MLGTRAARSSPAALGPPLKRMNDGMRNRSRGVDYAPTDYGYYGKRAEDVEDDDTVDVEFSGTFSKLDDDKRLAFGWASVAKVNGQPVVDKQGDYVDMSDIEDAAYHYVHACRVGGDMHRRSAGDDPVNKGEDKPHKVSDMVESMVFTDEKVSKLGLPEDFPRGWWVGYKIHDEPTWQMVKKGERTGFSIHGKGIRKTTSLDELMGY